MPDAEGVAQRTSNNQGSGLAVPDLVSRPKNNLRREAIDKTEKPHAAGLLPDSAGDSLSVLNALCSALGFRNDVLLRDP
jgi:hypothetical protein